MLVPLDEWLASYKAYHSRKTGGTEDKLPTRIRRYVSLSESGSMDSLAADRAQWMMFGGKPNE